MRERVIPISICMTPSLARRIRVRAAQRDMSRSRWICEVIEGVLRADDVSPVERATWLGGWREGAGGQPRGW